MKNFSKLSFKLDIAAALGILGSIILSFFFQSPKDCPIYLSILCLLLVLPNIFLGFFRGYENALRKFWRTVLVISIHYLLLIAVSNWLFSSVSHTTLGYCRIILVSLVYFGGMYHYKRRQSIQKRKDLAEQASEPDN